MRPGLQKAARPITRTTSKQYTRKSKESANLYADLENYTANLYTQCGRVAVPSLDLFCPSSGSDNSLVLLAQAFPVDLVRRTLWQLLVVDPDVGSKWNHVFRQNCLSFKVLVDFFWRHMILGKHGKADLLSQTCVGHTED